MVELQEQTWQGFSGLEANVLDARQEALAIPRKEVGYSAKEDTTGTCHFQLLHRKWKADVTFM